MALVGRPLQTTIQKPGSAGGGERLMGRMPLDSHSTEKGIWVTSEGVPFQERGCLVVIIGLGKAQGSEPVGPQRPSWVAWTAIIYVPKSRALGTWLHQLCS